MSAVRRRRNALVEKSIGDLRELADVLGDGVVCDAVRNLAKVAENDGDVRHFLGDILAHVAPAHRHTAVCAVAIVAGKVSGQLGVTGQ